MEYQLVLDRVTKQYGPKIACDRISLQAGPGVYGLLGANGAGKTTLLRMICGVLRPTSGDIRFAGLDVSSEGYRARLGYLPQDFGYYPEFTALDFLLYLAALKGLPRAAARQQSRDLLELVGLTGEAGHRIRTFSGGMRQRLGIAQALLGSPKLLILDEPTNGLDPAGIQEMRALIAQMPKSCGATVLISSHLLSELEQIVEQVGIVNRGKLLFQGPLTELQHHSRGDVCLRVLRPRAAAEVLRESGVRAAEGARPGEWTLPPLREELLAELVRTLAARGAGVVGLTRRTKTLEEIFLSLTGEPDSGEEAAV